MKTSPIEFLSGWRLALCAILRHVDQPDGGFEERRKRETGMDDWQLFNDARFALQFKCPSKTPQGHQIEKIESLQNETLRVHFLSREAEELYFEVTKYLALSPKLEYQQHRENLERRFPELTMTELKVARWKSFLVYEYSFAWSLGRRSVILIEMDDAMYRILYDPRSSLTGQMLSTVEWIDEDGIHPFIDFNPGI